MLTYVQRPRHLALVLLLLSCLIVVATAYAMTRATDSLIEHGLPTETRKHLHPTAREKMRECDDLRKKYEPGASKVYGAGLYEKCPTYFDKP